MWIFQKYRGASYKHKVKIEKNYNRNHNRKKIIIDVDFLKFHGFHSLFLRNFDNFTG